MKKILNTIFLATFLFAAACSDGYDDTRIKKDLDDVGQILDELEQAVDGLRTQMDALTQLINSSFVSLISTDAEGNYVITYIDRGGESRTLTLATQKEVVTLPIVGIAKDEDGVWYWRQTSDNGETYEWILVDGEKVPAGGEKPEVGIDAEGFWTVNGKPITDAKGNKVLADDVSNILFKEAYVDEKTGEAVFILADGTELRLQMFEALSVSFDSPTYTAVPDYASKVKIRYTVGGSQAEGALVDIFTAYNVDAEIDESISTITVSLKEGAQEGNILVMAHAGGNTILKPLFFTYGTAEIQDPVYNGSTADIVLEGDMTQFEVEVSASIDYEVTVEESASKWLIYNSTRAMTTLTHVFTADYYEDASGALRTGEIRFSNALYDISAAIVVKQSPKIPEGGGGGISTAADLMGFAAAVNAGASTARWENEAGEVVLLNDIDMAAVESWTPIGGVDASEYNTTTPYKTVNPFKGTFDGQGFAVKNLNYTADMSTGKWGYAFFGSLDGATVRNLMLGDPDTDITWTFTGDAPKATSFGSGRRDEELDHRRPRQVAGMRELRVRTHGQDHQQRQRRQRHADGRYLRLHGQGRRQPDSVLRQLRTHQLPDGPHGRSGRYADERQREEFGQPRYGRGRHRRQVRGSGCAEFLQQQAYGRPDRRYGRPEEGADGDRGELYQLRQRVHPYRMPHGRIHRPLQHPDHRLRESGRHSGRRLQFRSRSCMGLRILGPVERRVGQRQQLYDGRIRGQLHHLQG